MRKGSRALGKILYENGITLCKGKIMKKKYNLGRTRYGAKACCAHELPLFARGRHESPTNLKEERISRTGFWLCAI